MRSKKIIGITIGDSFEDGAQIAVKAIENSSFSTDLGLILIGSLDTVINAMNYIGSSMILNTIKEPSEICFKTGVLNLIDVSMSSTRDYKKDYRLEDFKNMSLTYAKKSIELCANESLDSFILGPTMNYYNISCLSNFYADNEKVFQGDENSDIYYLMLIRGAIRIVYIYNDSTIETVIKKITRNRIYEIIKLTNEILKKMNVASPKIAVTDVPYFEQYKDANISKMILSATQAANSEGIVAIGPISPDVVYLKAASGEYDAIVDIYHEKKNKQMETIGFEFDLKNNRWYSPNGIEIILGGSIVGLSVSHDASDNKVTKKTVNSEVLEKAIEIASKLVEY